MKTMGNSMGNKKRKKKRKSNTSDFSSSDGSSDDDGDDDNMKRARKSTGDISDDKDNGNNVGTKSTD